MKQIRLPAFLLSHYPKTVPNCQCLPVPAKIIHNLAWRYTKKALTSIKKQILKFTDHVHKIRLKAIKLCFQADLTSIIHPALWLF
ncbi:hypothetical protein SAMN04487941_2754 [Pontibacter akesuensis]|uniref:Uncharacterized protein n=1 Tax=Pontibacter akesuensis TaxID=388950 RepID=A0A1I7JDL8_9BACT|nr:hypothetical protein SAMN04487941_2754 [Pontibacter akesuensis]